MVTCQGQGDKDAQNWVYIQVTTAQHSWAWDSRSLVNHNLTYVGWGLELMLHHLMDKIANKLKMNWEAHGIMDISTGVWS